MVLNSTTSSLIQPSIQFYTLLLTGTPVTLPPPPPPLPPSHPPSPPHPRPYLPLHSSLSLSSLPPSLPQDWWNAQDLAEYLRKWNPVIQEWFKDYVYHHLRRHTHPTLAILLILLISAVAHDLLVGCGVGFFVPLYILEYSVGGTRIYNTWSAHIYTGI